VQQRVRLVLDLSFVLGGGRQAVMKTLYLCGASNPEGVRLALRIDRAQRRWAKIVVLDDDPARHGGSILGIEVAGPFLRLAQADPADAEVANLVARSTAKRAAAAQAITRYGLQWASLISPDVDVLGTVLGEGVTVYGNATVAAGATVGDGSVVFMGAIVGHGSTVGRGCVIAPNAVINARVRLGDRVYVGSCASILPEIEIGEGATIAAGATVLTRVPENSTALAVPAKVLRFPPKAAPVAAPDAEYV
jgi:sugar O-acyltransferase (sialic acid O-acetyltransferase NeuD family)